MDSFIIVDMYIFIVIAFLWTPLIKDHILRYVVYKPYLLYYYYYFLLYELYLKGWTSML